MDTFELELKVDKLEGLLGHYITHTNLLFDRADHRMDRFEQQIQQAHFDRLARDKKWEQEHREETRAWNKKWGDLANKMGTMVEDIIAPAIRPVIRHYFQQEPIFFARNVKRHSKALNLRTEVDVMVETDDCLYLVEVRSEPEIEYIERLKKKPNIIRQLFPEYANKKMILIFGSLDFDEEFVPVATAAGIYLLAYRQWEYMTLINFKELNPELAAKVNEKPLDNEY